MLAIRVIRIVVSFVISLRNLPIKAVRCRVLASLSPVTGWLTSVVSTFLLYDYYSTFCIIRHRRHYIGCLFLISVLLLILQALLLLLYLIKFSFLSFFLLQRLLEIVVHD